MSAVEICPICDIAGCRHIRERKAKMTHQTDKEVNALVAWNFEDGDRWTRASVLAAILSMIEDAQ